MARLTKVTLPLAAPAEQPTVKICINREWLQIIHTCLSRLEWQSSWIPNTDVDLAEQRVFQLYEVLRNVQNCGDDIMTLLRQNPDNTCILEQSVDNGQTWQVAFDFSLCESNKIRSIYINTSINNSLQIQNIANTLFQTWQETTNITEINNYTTINYGGEGSETNLCFAVLVIVNSVIEEIVAVKEADTNDTWIIVGVATAALATAALAFALPAAAAWAGAAGAALGAIARTGFNAYTAAQIRDANTSAIANAVYCALRGTSTAYDAMSLPVTPVTTLSGVELEIYNRIAAAFNAQPSAEKLRFWQSWMNILGESRRVNKEASICACVQTHIRIINFDNLMPETITRGTVATGAGHDGSNALYTQVINTSTARTYIAEFQINVPANARIKRLELWARRTGNLNDIRAYINGNYLGTINVGSAWAFRAFTCDVAASNVATITFSYGAIPSSSWTMWHYFDDVYVEYEA